MKVDWPTLLFFLFAAARIRGDGSERSREERQILYPPPLVYPFGGTFKVFTCSRDKRINTVCDTLVSEEDHCSAANLVEADKEGISGGTNN